ncbi:MAG TPA: WYL domain-containing protein [Acidimicrobiia bacterium]
MSALPESGTRLQRVLALVPWIAAHPGVTLDELAARFEIDRAELEEDLELLPMCGLPPYTADRLIDLVVADDGAVSIRLAEYFERPLRLTPGEGVALLAAGRALLGVPGSDPEGPLGTGLAKLEHALGATGTLAVHVAGADHLQQLRDAVEDGRQVEIDYYSSARDEMTTRVVDPVRVFHALGAWYLAAWCHRAVGDRLFRIDRVRAVRPTGRVVEQATARPERDAELVYRPAGDDPRVQLRLDREAAWVLESIPVEHSRARRGGKTDVTLAVSGPAFLERLVLSLGPRATVLGPADAKAAVADAARRVLARYHPDEPSRRPEVDAAGMEV